MEEGEEHDFLDRFAFARSGLKYLSQPCELPEPDLALGYSKQNQTNGFGSKWC